jgi:hypothetical protein
MFLSAPGGLDRPFSTECAWRRLQWRRLRLTGLVRIGLKRLAGAFWPPAAICRLPHGRQLHIVQCFSSAVTSARRGLGCRQLGQDRLIYLILAEDRLILPEAQAPQPDHNVHEGAHSRLLHIIVRSGESVYMACTHKRLGPNVRIRRYKDIAWPREIGRSDRKATLAKSRRSYSLCYYDTLS